jgi:hypothetical protein
MNGREKQTLIIQTDYQEHLFFLSSITKTYFHDGK